MNFNYYSVIDTFEKIFVPYLVTGNSNLITDLINSLKWKKVLKSLHVPTTYFLTILTNTIKTNTFFQCNARCNLFSTISLKRTFNINNRCFVSFTKKYFQPKNVSQSTIFVEVDYLEACVNFMKNIFNVKILLKKHILKYALRVYFIFIIRTLKKEVKLGEFVWFYEINLCKPSCFAQKVMPLQT